MGESSRIDDPFERQHFDREVVLSCVRWYLPSGLSLREIAGRMAERGLPVAHTMLMRWIRRCAGASGRLSGGSGDSMPCSWRVEETRVEVHGERRYLYRAVDLAGGIIDFRFSDRRTAAGAQTFFGQVIRNKPMPQACETDGRRSMVPFSAEARQSLTKEVA